MTAEHILEAVPRRFRPYPAYKDSGVEWLGEIPAHWEVRKWRYCCRITEGHVDPEDDRYRDRILIAPNHIESGTGRILFTETAEEQGAISGKYVVHPGDLIYSKIRPALSKACVADGDWLCSADMYPVKVIAKDLLPRYLLYFILSKPFVRVMIDESMRVAMPKVNRDTLASSLLLVPKLDEQQHILTCLDRETARIDAMVAKKERLIELLQEKRTALITRAVTKGLDPGVPMKDSGVEWLGEIPAHWEMERIRHVVHRIEQGWSPECENREADEEEWGVLKAGCVNRGLFIESEHKALPSDLEPISSLEIATGDVLMSRASGSRELVGSVAIVPACRPRLLLCDKLFRLHADAGRVHRRFFALAMNSRLARWQIKGALSGGSGLANNIAQQVVKDLIVVLPNLDEQEAIGAFLDRTTAEIDALVAKVREAIQGLEELRIALISAAVTGKIDVRGLA